MLDFPEQDLSAQERAALAIWLLRSGWTPTTRELAQRLGLSVYGARGLLKRLARVIPLSQDASDWRWRLADTLLPRSDEE